MKTGFFILSRLTVYGSRPHRFPLLPSIRRPLADAEDDELGGAERRDADGADEPPVVEVVLRHRRAVAAHEESLVRLVAEERARLPLVEEEVLDGATDVAP